MNKKKTKFLFFFLILVVLGVMLYSYDFFTSRVTTPNLIIKTGKLAMTTYNDDKWIFLNGENATEIKCENYENSFLNAKPGDIFFKKILIKNTGTLDQNLNFTINENLPQIVKQMFEIEISGVDNKEKILQPKQSRDIEIKLTLKNKKNNNYHQNKIINFKQLQIANFLTVEGTQIKSI